MVDKGGRRSRYGHKLNLATGRSGLALDVVVEDGNPTDSVRCLPMLERRGALGRGTDPRGVRRRLRLAREP